MFDATRFGWPWRRDFEPKSGSWRTCMAMEDGVLLSRAVEGDGEALSELLLRFGPQVRAGLMGRINPKWQATLDEDDVMQASYLDAFIKIGQFRPAGVASFVGWLTQIAENNLRDAIRGLEANKRPDPAHRIGT